MSHLNFVSHLRVGDFACSGCFGIRIDDCGLSFVTRVVANCFDTGFTDVKDLLLCKVRLALCVVFAKF